MRTYWVVALAATLGACNGGPDPQNAAFDNQVQANETAPAGAATIPARFIGAWDSDTQSCTSAASATRLTIAPQDMAFGDGTSAHVASVKTSGDSVQVGGVLGSAGMTVERQYALSLTPAGKLAVVSDDKTVVRVRCDSPAAQPSATPLPDAQASNDAAQQGAPIVGIAPGELTLIDPQNGRTRHLNFGMPERDVVEALKLAAGAAVKSHGDRECKGSPMDLVRFGNGLTLGLRNGQFVGWSLSGPSKLTGMSGVGIGSSLAEIQSSYAVKTSETKRGTEFAAGDLHGLLDGTGAQAKVTRLWSGTICTVG